MRTVLTHSQWKPVDKDTKRDNSSSWNFQYMYIILYYIDIITLYIYLFDLNIFDLYQVPRYALQLL